MGRTRKCSRRDPLPEEIHLEGIRRLRSIGSNYWRLGYDLYSIKLSKKMSSKQFFKY